MIARLARRAVSLFHTLFRQRHLDRALDEELQRYLEHQIDARVARGQSPAEARRQVLAEEGGVDPIKEVTRERRIGWGLATLLQDVRYGARAMRRTPGFSLIACLTLAIGIGANVTMFTVMRSVLWRPLPYAAADRLVVIETDVRDMRGGGATPADVLDWRARSRALDAIATINEVDAHIVVNGEMERVAAMSVSDNLLPMLGVAPVLGRQLDARLDVGPEFVRAVLISHRLWQRLGGTPSVVGGHLTLNNMPLQIAGVLPSNLKMFLPQKIGTSEDIDVWFPTDLPHDRTYRGYQVVGRLAEGQTLEAATKELDAIRRASAAEQKSSADGIVTRVHGLHGAVTSQAVPALRALGLAVAFVLLISCVNVANLLVARASGRTRELAVRRALGAGRARIVKQLLTESALLSMAGGAAGLLLAWMGVRAIEWLRPVHLPRQSQVAIDAPVLWFSLAVSLGAAMLFGLLPALRFAAADAQALRAGRGEAASRGSRRLQRSLVVAEIALSIVPLVAAGLMLRSFVNLTHAPIGFTAENVVTARMPLSFRNFPYPQTDKRIALQLRAIEDLSQLPGVDAVSMVSPVPFLTPQPLRRYGPAGTDARQLGTFQTILPGYFDIVGIRLRQGRDLTRDDIVQKRPVVVVDARLAEAHFPGGAVGRQLLFGNVNPVPLDIVGVTEPVRVTQVRDDSQPHVFLPYHLYPVEMTIVLKSGLPPDALAPGIRRTVAALGTGRAVYDVKPLADFVRDSIAETRFTMLLLIGFACASLLLAAIGLYGTLAYLNAQRSREFGVRLALGATRAQILALVSRESALLTGLGAVAGFAGALLTARAMQGLLYGVEPVDAVTLGAVTLVIALVALAASIRPAWMAARVDPAHALRAD